MCSTQLKRDNFCDLVVQEIEKQVIAKSLIEILDVLIEGN